MDTDRIKNGKRPDLNGIYFRSAWEANYARYLNFLIRYGKIKSWRYEPQRFWFEGIKSGTTSYLPDFEITNLNGSIEYHEIKGYQHQKGQTALKRMAKYHPTVKIIVIGGREYREIKNKISRLIPEWE